jgi:hypothetical protein
MFTRVAYEQKRTKKQLWVLQHFLTVIFVTSVSNLAKISSFRTCYHDNIWKFVSCVIRHVTLQKNPLPSRGEWKLKQLHSRHAVQLLTISIPTERGTGHQPSKFGVVRQETRFKSLNLMQKWRSMWQHAVLWHKHLQGYGLQTIRHLLVIGLWRT